MPKTTSLAAANYTAKDIELLDALQGVRKRPAMYIGSTNLSGLHHLVWELIDNAVDEALCGFGDLITVTIHKDGSLSVEDEGRGIPVDIHEQTGLPAVQLIFSTLHSGGKFNSKVYQSSGGLHGVGAFVTNALSEYCDIKVFLNGRIHHLRFSNGGKVEVPLEVIGITKKHGTLVNFKPDPSIFPVTDFKWETIHNHLQESAYLLKGVRFVLIDERAGLKEEFRYPEGLKEYVRALTLDKPPLGEAVCFQGREENIWMEIVFQFSLNDYNESIYSYANNVRTRDGGTHEAGFKAGITRAVNDYAAENSLLRGKTNIEGGDIREGLTAVISLRLPEELLEYEGQTKGKLRTPLAAIVVNNFVYTNFSYFLKEHKEFAVSLIRKCNDAQAARIAARKAKEAVRQNKKARQETILSDKLTPAQSKDYAANELFIVEGESAGGTARKGRDRRHQAILPLRGKPLNTDSVTIERMLKNEEFATIINTIGAGIGTGFDVQSSHYGKIIIMTDADTDGAHIQTLLLTFFYHYMRPLIQKGMLYVALPPLYRVAKETKSGSKCRYAWTDKDLLEAKKAIGPGYRISRYKGLGEMNEHQLWETTMDPAGRQLLRVIIEDPLLVERRVAVLMGKDTKIRRSWVEENVDFDEVDKFLKEVI